MKILKKIGTLFDSIQIKNIYLFLFNLCVMLFLFVFSGENYTNDGYAIVLNGPELHIETFIGSYRFLGAFLYYLLSLTGHIPFFGSLYDVVILIVLTSLIVTCLVNVYKNQFDHSSELTTIIIDISVLVSILNVWFCDNLSFPECIFITAVGLFLCLSAVIIIIRHNHIWACVIS